MTVVRPDVGLGALRLLLRGNGSARPAERRREPAPRARRNRHRWVDRTLANTRFAGTSNTSRIRDLRRRGLLLVEATPHFVHVERTHLSHELVESCGPESRRIEPRAARRLAAPLASESLALERPQRDRARLRCRPCRTPRRGGEPRRPRKSARTRGTGHTTKPRNRARRALLDGRVEVLLGHLHSCHRSLREGESRSAAKGFRRSQPGSSAAPPSRTPGPTRAHRGPAPPVRQSASVRLSESQAPRQRPQASRWRSISAQTSALISSSRCWENSGEDVGARSRQRRGKSLGIPRSGATSLAPKAGRDGAGS